MTLIAPDLPAAERLRRQRIFESPLVDIGVFSAPAKSRYFGPQAPPGHFTVAFPSTAVGIRSALGSDFVTDRNLVTYYEPSDAYERILVDPRGDNCTFFAPSAELVQEFASAAGLQRGGGRIFGKAFGQSDTATFHRQRRLVDALRTGPAPVDWVEQEALLVLDGLAGQARSSTRSNVTPAARRHARRAREYLACHYANAPDLSAIADAAGCSVFHLSRSFKAEYGYTVHAYRVELALRDAHDQVMDGGRRLTDVACDLGFSSHSHLTATFARRFGVLPSRLRG
ncbi:MAG: helix-turn-helix domain-containing protein [Acidobacteria bacterium]|nr:helix-turn-helix domain-containing protein [Acidobacteriota bacterium]